MFMEEVYPIFSVLARKNSPACYHTGEFALFLHYSVHRSLSLYTSGSVAASQGLNFFSGYQVEVAGDGML